MIDRVDVVVVGGGIAGASVAYELAERASVALLEQESTTGRHATGRSAAVFTECYGDPVVRALAIASRQFLTSPPDGFVDDPILRERPLLFIATEAQEAALATALDDFRSMVPTVHGVTGETAVEMCPILDEDEVIGGVVEPHAQDLDVHALHLGFQAGLRQRGGSILTTRGLRAARRDGNGWLVETDGEPLRASVVVDAAGAWGDMVAEACGAAPIGLSPKRRTAFTFEPGIDHGDWPMVIDVDERFYFKPEGPHLLASPADETPMPPHDVKHTELDVATAIERIGAVTTTEIRHVRSAWAGLRTFTPDRLPVNGWDPDVPGFYWLVGQGGYGIKTSPAMARFAAGLIGGEGVPADLIGAAVEEATLSPARFR